MRRRFPELSQFYDTYNLWKRPKGCSIQTKYYCPLQSESGNGFLVQKLAFYHHLISGEAVYRWRANSKNGKNIRGKGKTKIGNDRPGVIRGRGRQVNAFDKATEPRSERIPKYKEKADMIRRVILDFAENRAYYSYADIAHNVGYETTPDAIRMQIRRVFKML